MKKSKKSQFLMLSAFIVMFIFVFIYSLETENYYIANSPESSLLNNIIYETCTLGSNSNGTQIDSRYSNFTIDVSSYCTSRDIICNLTIVNNTQIPPSGNWSQLDYSDYNYTISLASSTYNYTGNFTC